MDKERSILKTRMIPRKKKSQGQDGKAQLVEPHKYTKFLFFFQLYALGKEGNEEKDEHSQKEEVGVEPWKTKNRHLPGMPNPDNIDNSEKIRVRSPDNLFVLKYVRVWSSDKQLNPKIFRIEGFPSLLRRLPSAHKKSPAAAISNRAPLHHFIISGARPTGLPLPGFPLPGP